MDITSHYISLKPYLFATAYNMTGEVHEAEDIIQDAFEDVLKKKDKDIKNAKSYLTRIVINKSIDRLKDLKAAREHYPALWLPEPLITDTDSPHKTDVLPYAILYLIEVLNPIERAVFILRESFGESYDEIAALCGITTDNCRQILHRAKAKIKGGSLSSDVTEEKRNNLLIQEFLKACVTQNTGTLTELLRQDIVLYSDGGGKVVAARKILEGASNVAKFLSGVIRKAFDKWKGARQILVNNEPALMMPDDNGVYMVVIPEVYGGKLAKLFIMRNPDKIFLKDSVTK